MEFVQHSVFVLALPAICRELKNYENMQQLIDGWIDLATKLSNLRLAQKRP
jgi:hypothetical protein